MFVNEGEEEMRLRVLWMVVLGQMVTDVKGLDSFRSLEKCNLTNKDFSPSRLLQLLLPLAAAWRSIRHRYAKFIKHHARAKEMPSNRKLSFKCILLQWIHFSIFSLWHIKANMGLWTFEQDCLKYLCLLSSQLEL